MNILFLTTHFHDGGISRYCLSLASQLKKRGHRIFVASAGGNLTGRLSQEGIGHIALDIRTKSEASPKIWSSLLQLKKIIKENNIQLIHSQTRVTQVLAFWAEKFYKVPYVSTCHGFFKPRLFRRIFPAWGRAVIAISRPVVRHLIVDLGVPPEKVKYIRHGMDPAEFPAARQKYQLGKVPVIGIIARLSDVKGHEFLLKAMPEILRQFPSAKLLIIGEGPLKERLIKICAQLKISANVEFKAGVLDTASALSAMDVFVMPSLQEGLGLSIMEAMAAGVPVVASRVGGILDLIRDNETGLLAAAKDSAGLTSQIISLLKDEKLRQSLAKNAQDFLRRQFPLEKMIAETEALYRSVVNEK